jgi:YD repeat-containing protein
LLPNCGRQPVKTYDGNGNTLSKTNGTGTTSYAWDFENRLTSVTLPGTTGTISFTYDPFGRRIRKVSAAGTTIYVYDGDNIIEDLDGWGNLVERYTYGPGIDEPLVGQRQAGGAEVSTSLWRLKS